MMAYNQPHHNDPFLPGGRFNDLARQQGMRQPPGLPDALPLHQASAQLPQLSQHQPMSAAGLAAAAAAAASPASLESRMMMRRLMIRRAAQQAQDMQSLHNALLAEANATSIQQQFQQQQQQQQHQHQHQGALMQHRQAAAFLDQYHQSPAQGFDLLRSVSLVQQQQHQQQQRVQLGLPSIGQLDHHSSFLSPSPNQPPTRLSVGDFSMLPRAPFSREASGALGGEPLSPNNTIYSPSPVSVAPKNTVKLFVDEIREFDVLCGRGGRSNRKCNGDVRWMPIVRFANRHFLSPT